MDLSSLPDDLAVLVLQLCTCAALVSLEATCHRMKQLLQVPGAWRLPCDVHSDVHRRLPCDVHGGFHAGDDSQRAAVEAVHAVRTEHIARALVHKLMLRNLDSIFKEADGSTTAGFEQFFCPDPLSGCDPERGDDGGRVNPALYQFLCLACQLAPAVTVPTLHGLDELILVVELRHASDHHLDRCWVLQASEVHINDSSAYIADFVIGEAQAEAFPFDDNAFLVVWAVHRDSKAVALLHAAAPEDEWHGNMLAMGGSPINPAGQALYDRWSAASLVPRWHPRACRNRVFRAVDPMRGPGAPGCITDDREALCLSTHVSLQPAWLRAGSTASDKLIDPRAVPEGKLPTDVGADFVANSWRAASILIELTIEGARSNAASDRPTSVTHPDLPRLPPHPYPNHPDYQKQPGETQRSYMGRCFRASWASTAPLREASQAWARAKLLEQLTTNTLWLAPRAFRTASNGQQLQNRVNALLGAAASSFDGSDASDEDEENEVFSDDEDEEGDDEEGDDM